MRPASALLAAAGLAMAVYGVYLAWGAAPAWIVAGLVVYTVGYHNLKADAIERGKQATEDATRYPRNLN